MPGSARQGAIAVVVRDQKLLVIRRSRHVVRPGCYCFPGGGIEPGEDEETAVLREIAEELSLCGKAIGRLWQSVSQSNVELFWWGVELEAGQTPVANEQEVESFHWLSLPQIRELPDLLATNHAFLDAWQCGDFELHGIERPPSE